MLTHLILSHFKFRIVTKRIIFWTRQVLGEPAVPAWQRRSFWDRPSASLISLPDQLFRSLLILILLGVNYLFISISKIALIIPQRRAIIQVLQQTRSITLRPRCLEPHQHYRRALVERKILRSISNLLVGSLTGPITGTIFIVLLLPGSNFPQK